MIESIVKSVVKVIKTVQESRRYTFSEMAKYQNKVAVEFKHTNPDISNNEIEPVVTQNNQVCNLEENYNQELKVDSEKPNIELNFDTDELRKAVIYSEILSKPRAKTRRKCRNWS